MTWLLTAGMWIHLYLHIGALLPRTRTENAIWGELVTVFLSLPLIPLWGLLGHATKGTL